MASCLHPDPGIQLRSGTLRSLSPFRPPAEAQPPRGSGLAEELGGGVRILEEPRRGGEKRETWTPSGSLPRCSPQCPDLGNPPVLELGNRFPVWWWGRCPEGGVLMMPPSPPRALGHNSFLREQTRGLGAIQVSGYSSCQSLQVAVSPCRIGRSQRRGDSREHQCTWGLLA